MTDTETDEDLIIVPIEKRNCYFKSEKVPGHYYPVYGPNICLVSCTVEYMLFLCNCSYASIPDISSKYNKK